MGHCRKQRVRGRSRIPVELVYRSQFGGSGHERPPRAGIGDLAMRKWFGKQGPMISETVKRNIDSIAQLEQEFLRHRSTVACLSDRIPDVVGSPLFITAHV